MSCLTVEKHRNTYVLLPDLSCLIANWNAGGFSLLGLIFCCLRGLSPLLTALKLILLEVMVLLARNKVE